MQEVPRLALESLCYLDSSKYWKLFSMPSAPSRLIRLFSLLHIPNNLASSTYLQASLEQVVSFENQPLAQCVAYNND